MDRRVLLAALISGAMTSFGLGYWFRDNFTIEIVFDGKKQEDSLGVNVLDCPSCGLPSEIVGLAVDVDEDNIEDFYVLSCFGEHDPVAVTDAWLEENLE